MFRVVLSLILGIILTGCSETKAQPQNTTSETTLPVTSVIPEQTEKSKMVTMDEVTFDQKYYNNPGVAIGPPVNIEITNYQFGAQFQFSTYLHNGDGLKVKLLQVETEPDEKVATIPIRAVLANNGLLDIVSIESTLKDEKLEATAYDANTNLLTIKGFVPSEKRVVKITYKTISTFNINYFITSKAKEGFVFPPEIFEQFVEIETPLLVMRPMESKVINVKVTIPPNMKFSTNKLEFGIAASETSTVSSQMNINMVTVQPIYITLK